MPRLAPRALAALAALTLSSACTSTRTVPTAALMPLQTPQQREALVLDTAQGRVRVGPNTKLRFHLVTGEKTAWLRARSLRTNDDGVFVDGDRKDLGWAWGDIAQAEVKNFSGAKTFALLVGSAAVVATVVALAAASDGKCCASASVGVAEASLRTAHAAAVLASHGGVGPRADDSAAPDAHDEGAPPVAEHLFTGVERRRSVLEVVPSTQAMLPILAPGRYEQSAGVSLRLLDVWELGFVARAAMIEPRYEDATLRFVAAARAGLHLELDAERRFAIPVLFDIGGGPKVPLQTRLNLGLRIRATDTLSIGVYAPSPTYTRVRSRNQRDTFGQWTFPAGLELSLAL